MLKNSDLSALKLSDGVFILLINVKMPTTVGILTFMCRIIMCLLELSMKKRFTSRSGLDHQETFVNILKHAYLYVLGIVNDF